MERWRSSNPPERKSLFFFSNPERKSRERLLGRSLKTCGACVPLIWSSELIFLGRRQPACRVLGARTFPLRQRVAQLGESKRTFRPRDPDRLPLSLCRTARNTNARSSLCSLISLDRGRSACCGTRIPVSQLQRTDHKPWTKPATRRVLGLVSAATDSLSEPARPLAAAAPPPLRDGNQVPGLSRP